MSNNQWSKVQALMNDSTVVNVTIDEPAMSARGKFSGVYVTIDGLKGFVPFSELGLYRKPAELVGVEIPVKVIEATPAGERGRRLLLSRVQAVRDLQKQRLTELSALSEPRLVSGTVVAAREFGALVDLGNEVVGLVHRTELCADRAKEPSAVVQPGEVRVFEVVSVDMEKLRVGLSLRKVEEPAFVNSLSKGQVIAGRVARLRDNGAFIELGGPVDGFLRADKLPKGVKIADAYKVGEARLFTVTHLDSDKRWIRVKPYKHEDNAAKVLSEGVGFPTHAPALLAEALAVRFGADNVGLLLSEAPADYHTPADVVSTNS